MEYHFTTQDIIYSLMNTRNMLQERIARQEVFMAHDGFVNNSALSSMKQEVERLTELLHETRVQYARQQQLEHLLNTNDRKGLKKFYSTKGE